MKVDFKNGELIITPESELESYGLVQWKNNGSNLRIIELETTDTYLKSLVLPFLKDKQLLGAIKVVKEATGWGLKESKEYVDRLK